MRSYELMTVYPLEEEQFQAGKERVAADLAAGGVTELVVGDPVDRDLAYEVQKRRRARYVLYTFKSDPEKITAMDKAFKLNNNLLKYLFVKTGE
jgi:small subunit ribosomal protein S6